MTSSSLETSIRGRAHAPASWRTVELLSSRETGWARFVMLGGQRKFAPHAYRRTVLDRMLPVEFDAPMGHGRGAGGRQTRSSRTHRGRDARILMMRLFRPRRGKLSHLETTASGVLGGKGSRAPKARRRGGCSSIPTPGKESRFGKNACGSAMQQYGPGFR